MSSLEARLEVVVEEAASLTLNQEVGVVFYPIYDVNKSISFYEALMVEEEEEEVEVEEEVGYDKFGYCKSLFLLRCHYMFLHTFLSLF